jgi:hypothetical protein
MKYATLGPRGAILKVTDTEPDRVGDSMTVVSITDEQAGTVIDALAQTPRVLYTLADDELIPLREKLQADREAARIAAMTPEELQVKAAWDAAAAAFEVLPLGKQALWESVRVKVAAFIKKGDFAAAAETISTVPNLYTGMATDRDAFLALFQQ